MKFVAESIQSKTGQVFIRTIMARDMKMTVSDIRGEDVVQKTLPFDEFMQCMGQSVRQRETEQWLRIPKNFIPEGFLDGYLSTNGWSAVWRVPAAVRQFVHSSGHYRIPFPELLFYVSKGKYGGNRYVWVIDEKDRTYQYPFGNVSLDGGICMGNISLNEIETPDEFTEEFFLGKTNNDYFHPGDHVSVKYEQDELLRRLDGKKKFPERWLIRRGTLDDVLKMAKRH